MEGVVYAGWGRVGDNFEGIVGAFDGGARDGPGKGAGISDIGYRASLLAGS